MYFSTIHYICIYPSYVSMGEKSARACERPLDKTVTLKDTCDHFPPKCIWREHNNFHLKKKKTTSVIYNPTVHINPYNTWNGYPRTPAGGTRDTSNCVHPLLWKCTGHIAESSSTNTVRTDPIAYATSRSQINQRRHLRGMTCVAQRIAAIQT